MELGLLDTALGDVRLTEAGRELLFPSNRTARAPSSRLTAGSTYLKSSSSGSRCWLAMDQPMGALRRTVASPCTQEALGNWPVANTKSWKREVLLNADSLITFLIKREPLSPKRASTFSPRVPNHPNLGITMSTIEETLAERGTKYGDFTDHAKISQDLKDVMSGTPGWQRLTSDKKEALQMIVHKIGRILNGDPEFHDSWHDIVGYAQLAADGVVVKP